MRTTVQIDDDLIRDLKKQAQHEKTSLAKLINRVLRHGMRALLGEKKQVRPFREKTFSMGEPKVDLDKALTLAALLEDEEVCEELARRK